MVWPSPPQPLWPCLNLPIPPCLQESFLWLEVFFSLLLVLLMPKSQLKLLPPVSTLTRSSLPPPLSSLKSDTCWSSSQFDSSFPAPRTEFGRNRGPHTQNTVISGQKMFPECQIPTRTNSQIIDTVLPMLVFCNIGSVIVCFPGGPWLVILGHTSFK